MRKTFDEYQHGARVLLEEIASEMTDFTATDEAQDFEELGVALVEKMRVLSRSVHRLGGKVGGLRRWHVDVDED